MPTRQSDSPVQLVFCRQEKTGLPRRFSSGSRRLPYEEKSKPEAKRKQTAS